MKLGLHIGPRTSVREVKIEIEDRVNFHWTPAENAGQALDFYRFFEGWQVSPSNKERDCRPNEFLVENLCHM